LTNDDTSAHSFLKMLDPANGLAPGDPARMAARIIDSVDMEPEAPLPMLLGSQALGEHVRDATRADRRLRGATRPRRLTDFPPGE
jgi:hypothetical protein